MKKPATYAEAGVNQGAASRAIEVIRQKVKSTYRPEVVGGIGGFGGVFALDRGRWADPLMVSATDGVGTKLVIAQRMGIHDTVGVDLLAMCADDVVAHGAEPLFFQDYIAIGKIDERIVSEIIDGIVSGCKESGCALIGGELAEHPGVMGHDDYDLAGFCVGAVERDRLITGEGVSTGDVIVGIESSGLHSNGYSLVRKVLLDDMGLRLEDRPMELTTSLGEELLRPTTIYAPALLSLYESVDVMAMAHITGGGIPENLGRTIPDQFVGTVDTKTWEVPAIFELIRSLGKIEAAEMFSTFNMGIGMIVVVAAGDANVSLDLIRSRGHRAHEIGIVEASDSEDRVRLL